MSFVSIAVPVYHNAASLPDLLAKFQELSRKNPADQFEFIFVDDGSRDNSFDVLQMLAAAEPRVRIVKLSRNFGSNAAIMAGIPCITTVQGAGAAVQGIEAMLGGGIGVRSLQDMHAALKKAR